MPHRATILLLIGFSMATVGTRAYSATGVVTDVSVNLIVNEQEASSVGHATYDPGLCLQCTWHGTHAISGGSSIYNWTYDQATLFYDRQLSEPVQDAKCYRGHIEAAPTGGSSLSQDTIEKCAPCVLALEVSGSGSVSGATVGTTSYTCGTRISLTATPNTGWLFSAWSGAISSQSPSLSFTLDSSKSLTATFVEDGGGGTGPGHDPQNPTDPCNPFDPSSPCYNSPIIVNLGLGGYRLSSVDDPVAFDLNADGAAEQTAWTARGTPMAFLAYDRNGNGVIDDGSELFGNHTPLRSGGNAANGFIALAELDSNGDGVIDVRDDAWPLFLLWTDWNHDGVCQPNEVQLVSSSGVTALDLSHHWTGRRDTDGNVFRYEGQMHFAGSTRAYYDVYLRSIP